MGEKLLEVKDLIYSYDGSSRALNIDSFALEKGERLAVLGANGAGKSTFFLCLNGVLNAGGSVYYKGTRITKKLINELRRGVGIVFQDADKQIIASTVGAEVSFGPMNLGLERGEVEKRVDAALRYMNISDMRDRPPHYLSGGEKKRVSIADIIAMQSEIIIFDEPTASLDPVNIKLLEEVLAKLQSEDKTIVVSTHDVDFAYRWASRAVIINGGRIIADGTPEAVFCDDEKLKSSNLARPVIMELAELLKVKGVLPEGSSPKSVTELKEMLE